MNDEVMKAGQAAPFGQINARGVKKIVKQIGVFLRRIWRKGV